MRKRVLVAVAAAATMLLGILGVRLVSRGRGTVRTHGEMPNVVLIEICSLRCDRLGCNGYGRPTTPTIDALARRGTLFSRCVSPSSRTRPSTASILSGLNPNVHQLTDSDSAEQITADGFMPKRSLSADAVTIAEAFKQGGYDTAGFVANVNAWPAFGVSQGFDRYDYAYPWSGQSMASRFGEWVRGRGQQKPFFAFMLFLDVHHPYGPPYAFYEEFCRDSRPVPVLDYPAHRFSTNYPFLYSIESRPDWSKIRPGQFEQWVDLYDAGVRSVDDAVYRVIVHLVEQGLGDNTAIVVVADHGDSLTEHDRTSHGNSLYQELIHVPLVMYLPGIGAGRVVDDLVRSIDVYPTLCDYVGVEGGPNLQGESLLPLLRRDKGARGPTFALSSLGDKRDAIQDSRWKLIRYGVTEFYDVSADPRETVDASSDRPAERRAMERRLDELVSADEALRRNLRVGFSRLSPDAVDHLRSLGYIK